MFIKLNSFASFFKAENSNNTKNQYSSNKLHQANKQVKYLYMSTYAKNKIDHQFDLHIKVHLLK